MRAFGFCALLALAACAGGGGPLDAGPPAVERVIVAASDARVWVGSSADLSAAVYDASGALVTPASISWTSSSDAVADVRRDASGAVRVRGVAPGTATIRATVDGVTGTLQVRVEAGGEIRFRYSGPLEGEFVASGPTPLDRNVGVSQTELTLQDDMLSFFGMQVHPDGSADWIQIQLPGISRWNAWGFVANCRSVQCIDWVGLVFDETFTGRRENQRLFMGLSGTAEVTEHRLNRIKIRFSGSFCEIHYPEPYLDSCTPDAAHPVLRVEGTADMPL